MEELMSRTKREKNHEAYPTWWPNYRADRSIRIPVILLNFTSPVGAAVVVVGSREQPGTEFGRNGD
jgi:hypothetical protein